MTPRRVSNSEVMAWLSCKMKYYFSFDLGLMPKPNLEARLLASGKPSVRTLDIGNLGHEILAVYYELLKNDLTVEDAIQECRDRLSKMALNPTKFNFEVITATLVVLNRYWAFYAENDHKQFEVLEVEKEYDIPLTDEFSYVFRFDLLLKERRTGKIILVDHKFKYDFFTDQSINLSGQVPKYLGALRYNNIRPDIVWLNQIRSRIPSGTVTHKELFRRSPVVPSNNKISNALREQIIVSQQIAEWRDQPPEIRKATAFRSMDAYPRPCESCPFKKPCTQDYDGGNITHTLMLEFIPNSYNYNRDEIL